MLRNPNGAALCAGSGLPPTAEQQQQQKTEWCQTISFDALAMTGEAG